MVNLKMFRIMRGKKMRGLVKASTKDDLTMSLFFIKYCASC